MTTYKTRLLSSDIDFLRGRRILDSDSLYRAVRKAKRGFIRAWYFIHLDHWPIVDKSEFCLCRDFIRANDGTDSVNAELFDLSLAHNILCVNVDALLDMSVYVVPSSDGQTNIDADVIEMVAGENWWR